MKKLFLFAHFFLVPWMTFGGGFIYPPNTVSDITTTNDVTAGDDVIATDDAYVGDDVLMGNVNVEFSTASTSGNSSGQIYTAWLGGPTNALEGNLLIATTSAAGHGLTVAVARNVIDQTNWVGIATAAVTTGNVIHYYSAGSLALALTTGTVNPGDILVSSNTGSLGYLGQDNTPTTGADVGVALSSGNAQGGRTLIRVR